MNGYDIDSSVVRDAGSLSRRGFLTAGGAVLGAAALTACGGSSSHGGAKAKIGPALSASSRATGSIRILDDNTNKIFAGGVIDSFQKQTGITVAKYVQANFNDLHDRLATLFGAQDSSYDVVMTWAAWSAEFGRAGWLEPIAKSEVPTDVLPAALDAVSWAGTVYGLPKFASAQTMFYNKQLFHTAGLDPETPPATWDEFVTAAQKLTTGGRYGFACDMGNTDGAYQNFLKVLLLNGGTMYDADNKPTFNDEKGVDALTRLVGLLHTQKVMNPSSLSITNSSDLNNLFANGSTGIVFNWPAQWAAATASSAKIGVTNIGNASLPGIAVKTASIDGSEGFAINKFSKNKQAALAWLKYVTTGPVQRQMVAQEGWFPVSETLLKDSTIQGKLPPIKSYLEEAQYAIKRYGAPWYSDVVQGLATDITKAMLGKLSPKAALDDAAKRAQPIIAKFK